MRIVHAIQMPASQQGGLEVLVRTLIADSHPDDAVFLVSQDQPQDLLEIPCRDQIAGHLRSPAGALPESWNDDLIHWIRQNQIDICHFHLPGTFGWNVRSWNHCPITRVALAGIPTVVTNHQATDFFNPSEPARPFWRRCAATATKWPGKARQLSAVQWEASVSLHDLAVTRRYFPQFGSKLIQIYHSRLDAELTVSPAPPSKTILNVATIAFRKGQHLLVEAFARVAGDFPGWKLSLVGYVGEKECAEQIHRMIREGNLQDRVRLHGPDPEPNPFYQTCEIYVQPSLVEGLGLSLQEAMFQGRACIGSATGGIPELIDGPETGVLCPAGDVTALAAALSRLMSDSDLRNRLGNSARASILRRGMSRQAMSATYRDLYRQAIQAR
jgi:glycosyltransferase involved in cell wall biosynthesis